MALLFNPPMIQAKTWEEAQRGFNKVIRQLVLQFNNIYTGPNIPNTRLVAGTKIDGVETGADVTGDNQAATIASQGDLATLDTVDTAQIDNDAVEKEKVNIASIADIASALGTQVSGTLQSGVVINDSLRKIYDNTLTGTATSVTLSSLTGDTALHYFISTRWVRNGNINGGGGNFGIQLNADTGVSNYGWRTIFSDGNGYSDNTWFMLWMGRADTDDYTSQGHAWLEAQSGFYRQLQGTLSRQVGGSAIAGMYVFSDCWWNTADEITSMKFLSEDATALNIGTRLEVWERVD